MWLRATRCACPDSIGGSLDDNRSRQQLVKRAMSFSYKCYRKAKKVPNRFTWSGKIHSDVNTNINNILQANPVVEFLLDLDNQDTLTKENQAA